MDKKKLSAAVAAVMICIRTGGATAFETVPEPVASASGEGVKAPAAVSPAMNLWGISGRQAHMQGNAMMQLRMFKS